MNAFEYASPSTLNDFFSLLSDTWGEAEILAGGTDLVTSLKQDLSRPQRVVSLKNITDLSGINRAGDSLQIGATTTLAKLAANADVQRHFPALATAVDNIGSPQMINIGTVGGDLLQRPRCWYYRQGFGLFGTSEGTSLIPSGDNRYHAIFGNKGPAYFVNPSSLAPGLIALSATLTLQSAKGTRKIDAADFFTTPKSESDREYVLKPNEILTEIRIPLNDLKNATYEIRPRRGLDWPMVTASIAYRADGAVARDTRVVLGHVAPVPWHAEKASRVFEGLRLDGGETYDKVGEAATDGAKALSRNAYKIAQVKVAVTRAIRQSIPA